MRTPRILGLVSAVLLASSPATAEPKVGKAAPDFRATTFSGKTVQLSDFKGQVLILNFWATWCGPCKRELPLLNAYYKHFEDRGLRVLAVTTEGSVPDYELKPLSRALEMPLLHDIRGPYSEIGGAVPTNYVIDREGVVRYAEAGAFNLDVLNELLVPLLNEPAPTSPNLGAPSALRAQSTR